MTVPLLMFPQIGIDSHPIFTHDGYRGESSYSRLDDLWREKVVSTGIIVEAVVHDGQLFTISNRRLAALRAYQAWTWNTKRVTGFHIAEIQNIGWKRLLVVMRVCRPDSA